MFSPDRDRQPYFSLDHIKLDNIHFVTNLRKNSKLDEKKMIESKINGHGSVNNASIDSHDKDHDHKQSVDGHKVHHPHSMKDSNCRNQQCIHNVEHYRDEHQLVSRMQLTA